MSAQYGTESHASDSTGNLTSLACDIPLDTASGDLLIAYIDTGSGSTGFSAPTGWGRPPAPLNVDWTDSNDSAGAVFIKVAGSSEPADYTFSWTTESPVNISIIRVTGSNGTIRSIRRDTAPGPQAAFTSTVLSGTQSGDLIIATGIEGDDNGVTGSVITPPGTPWTTVNNIAAGPKYQANSWLAGPQGTQTAEFQSNSSSAWWNIITCAVEPSSNVTVDLPVAQAVTTAYPLKPPVIVALPVAQAVTTAYPVNPGTPVIVLLPVAETITAAYPLTASRELLVSVAARAGTDDYGNVYPAGLQVTDGVISGTVIKGLDWIINSNGMFFYSGTPSASNLRISIAGAVTADPFGTTVQQGLTIFGPSGAAVNIQDSGAEAAIILTAAGLANSTVASQIITSAINAGLANEIAFTVISSGKENGNADAAVQLFSESADATSPAQMVIEFGGTVWGTVQLATGLIVDSWHDIALDSGWSSVVQPQYRFLPSGDVEVRGQATHAGTTAAVNINGSNPVPAEYRPGATRVYRSPVAGDSAGTVEITSAGIFVMRASGFTASAVFMDGMYSI